MDSTTLVNVGVIAVFIFVVILIYHNVRAAKRHLAGDSRQEQAFKRWLKDKGYAPEHFHFYRGSGIAFSKNDEQLALFNNDAAAFHRKDEVREIKAHEEVTGRMVGAAPGVVRQVNTTLYALDIYLNDGGQPHSKITFSDSKHRSTWEARLHGGMKSDAG